MDNLKVKAVSFKGAYKIQGQAEIIDEICWYLQKKKKAQDPAFDFLDIRMQKNNTTYSDRILKPSDPTIIKDKNAGDEVLEHLLDLISIRKGTQKPFPEVAQKENIDLFLTNTDKEKTENKLIKMIEDSLANAFNKTELNEKAKILLEHLSKMRKGLSSGKPIINIKPEVIENHLQHIDFAKVNILSAEEAFEAIKKGKFDITTGSMKK